ncbi:MAG: tetratricopeptide repeat protein [Planctomycetota bacterium]|nr:tetratricopeptide repeat protein [Planctomycetota bacterium]
MNSPGQPSASRGRAVPWPLLAGLAIAVATALAYLPVRANGFIWDDDAYITHNTNHRSLEGLRRIWLQPTGAPQYYPLVHTTFWIEHHLWGLDPRGYHAVNVALHIASALLLWRLLERLHVGRAEPTRAGLAPLSGFARTFSPAWLIAAAFALHPVCVESVAWATERKNVLMALFYLLTLSAYVRFERLDDRGELATPPAPARQWGWYIVALLCFVAAMLSKTVACSFGASMLVLIFWKRGRVRLRELWPLAPFLALGLALGLLTAWLERHHVGALGADWELSLAQRTLIAGRALWFYWGKILWPADVSFIYERWAIDVGSWAQWLFPIAAAGLVALVWFGRRTFGRGPLAAVLFFGLTIFPALGFLNIYPMRYTWAADHYQYVASIGLIALSLGVAGALLRRLGPSGAVAGRLLAAAALVALAATTHAQVKTYRDLKTLWTAVIERSPRAAIATNNLGLIVMGEGDDARAEKLFRAAIAANDGHYEAHNNLAVLLSKAGDEAGALEHLRRAVQANPDYVDARINLGVTLAKRGELDEAVGHLRHALGVEPRMADAWATLGQMLLQQGKSSDAIDTYSHALEIDGRNIATITNLARALRSAGRTPEAVAWLKRGLEVSSTDATLRRELAATLMGQASFTPTTGPATAPATTPATQRTRWRL